MCFLPCIEAVKLGNNILQTHVCLLGSPPRLSCQGAMEWLVTLCTTNYFLREFKLIFHIFKFRDPEGSPTVTSWQWRGGAAVQMGKERTSASTEMIMLKMGQDEKTSTLKLYKGWLSKKQTVQLVSNIFLDFHKLFSEFKHLKSQGDLILRKREHTAILWIFITSV